MPSFCRHNRLESSCPVCSRKRRQAGDDSARAAKPVRRQAPRAGTGGGTGARRARRRGADDVVVRRLARAAEDGFASELVPGLRASADAILLAEQLAFAAARHAELGSSPPGLYEKVAESAGDGRREDALWLLAQIVAIGPHESWQPGVPAGAFDAISAAAVPWAGGALPSVAPHLVGPRGSTDVDATLTAYRAWAQRSGGQWAGISGDASWSAERRFDRAFERLALPGFARGPRYDFLLVAGALGLADLRPASLNLLADTRDPVLAAAKRVFGFGDPIVVARRASELSAATALPLGVLDLALLNWARLADDPDAGRITAGSAAVPDPDVRALVMDALGLAAAHAAD